MHGAFARVARGGNMGPGAKIVDRGRLGGRSRPGMEIVAAVLKPPLRITRTIILRLRVG